MASARSLFFLALGAAALLAPASGWPGDEHHDWHGGVARDLHGLSEGRALARCRTVGGKLFFFGF